MINISEDSKPPGHYIGKRLKKNKPAIVGLIIISCSFLISILGYLIMPDQTTNANDGAVQIQKQSPGFVATFLKIRKNIKIEKVNFIQRAIHGQESEYIIVPIKEYKIEGHTVRAQIFGKEDYYKDYYLLDVVKPLSFNSTNSINDQTSGAVSFTNIDGEKENILYDKLIDEFHANNIETRTYWFGTDKMGRDILSRLLFGTRISLSIGFIAVLISMLLGLSLGSIAGFFGGKTDMFILWLCQLFGQFPE